MYTDNSVKFDYSKLRGRIKEKFNTEGEFAKILGMPRSTLSQKLSNKNGFSRTEMLSICEKLGLDKAEIPDYFFAY